MASRFHEDLSRKARANPAYYVLAALLLSIFLVGGGASNALAIGAFATAWFLAIRDARAEGASLVPRDLLVLAFVAAIAVRLLLPPYSVDGTGSPAAATRALLLAGLYGLTIYVYARLPFEHILWMIAGAALACVTIASVLYVVNPPTDARMVFLGRASHPIIGAGAIAVGALAALALLVGSASDGRSRRTRIVIALMLAVLAAAVFLSGSRGPLISLGLAVLATPIILLFRSRGLIIALAIGAWALVTASVLLEAPLKQLLCPTIELACRPSLRHGVWSESIARIMQHPLWGSGYSFRFEGIPHSHNGYLGMALHYGIPMCVFFIALVVTALSNAAQLKDRQQRLFIASTLIFANGFMGSDLSDPVRFFNTHYLFLWFPLFLAFAAARKESGEAQVVEPASILAR